jgi:hypothetical protein
MRHTLISILAGLAAIAGISGLHAQPSGLGGKTPVMVDEDVNNIVVVPNDTIAFEDDYKLQLGTGLDFWWAFNSASNWLALATSDGDGAGADFTLLRIPSGSTNLVFTGNVVLSNENPSEYVKTDGSSQLTTAATVPWADLISVPTEFTPSAHGHDATEIADGSVSNTEFQFLDGATSNIQVQINGLSGGHDAVTLSGTPDYITLVGQDIVRGAVHLTDDVTGTLADGSVVESNVTQHEAALSIGASQVTAGTFGTGNYVVPGNLGLDEYLTHNGDAGTLLRFQINQIDLTVDGSGIQIVPGLVSTTNIFQVSSLTASQYVKTDASQNLVSAATVPWADLTDVPTEFTPSAHVHAGEDITSGIVDESVIDSDIARDSELHDPVTLSGTRDYITLVGQDIVRGAIHLTDDVTGTLANASVVASNVTQHQAALSIAATQLTTALGDGQVLTAESGAIVGTFQANRDVRAGAAFDGVDDYIQIADADEFTFSDGTDNLPFTVAGWIRMTDATTFTIIGKYGTSAATREWLFYSSETDKLAIIVFDGTNAASTASTTAITSLEGQWIHVAATVPGAGPNSGTAFSAAMDGVALYINGKAIAATATNNGSLAVMPNTSQALRMGRQSSVYGKGSTRGVQVFNRELSALEIRRLYQEGVSFADKSGGGNGAAYTSDFTAGVNGWTASQGAVAGNIDTIGGEDDWLRFTINTTSSADHSAQITISPANGKRYRIRAKYFIPSSNSLLDGLRIDMGLVLVSGVQSTLDSATYFEYEFTANTSLTPIIRFRAMDGASSSMADAGGDDVFYLKDVVITRIGTLLDLPMDEGIGYQVHDRTSNNHHGSFSSTSGPAWIHSQNRGRVLGYDFSGNSTILQPALAGATLPPNALIESIVVRETSGANPAAPYISTTAGDTDTKITLGRDIGASEIRSLGIIDTVPGGTAAEELFINQDGSWAGLLNVTINYSVYE